MKQFAARLTCILIFFLAMVVIAYAWGVVGHESINKRAVLHLPREMNSFKADSSFFEKHAFDADIRKDYTDTSFFSEWPRHYINIDDYPNFRTLTHNLDSAIMRFGWEYVKQDGINPWATKWVLDSLTAQLARGDTIAKYTASDLGHYVADAHEPLNCTVNFDGQFTGNHGIQGRYETYMINIYHAALFVHPDSIHYISSPIDFAFEYIDHSHSLVDSILAADNYAKSASGWDGSSPTPSSYYAALWQKCQNFTQDQFQRATVDLACLWYTAWVNAGLSTSVGDFVSAFPDKFELRTNYPNPFNPSTTISYSLSIETFVRLTIFSTDGREIVSLINGKQEAGEHRVTFDGSNIASGIYFYQLRAGGFSKTGKMVLLR